jgi:NTE family protein
LLSIFLYISAFSQLSKPWHDKWKAGNPAAASEEAARRYYSVKKLLLDKMRNNMYYLESIINDDRFSDSLYTDEGPNDDNPNCKDPNCKKPNFLNNVWFLHSSKPLQESIENYVCRFPILTDRKNMQPRLLVFNVDVAEDTTVTFDSYPKADGCRKSEYAKYENEGGCENVINYNDGIGIDHIMASSTLPEFYKYTEVPINPTVEQKNQNSTTIDEKSNKNKNNNIRYFWDGGLLCNTPLRELLNAHQEYWKEVENKDEIPALDIYIINVHPSKIDIDKFPKDHDGVKDRQNDITYGDRTSHYDEKMMRLITDYTNFATEMKRLVEEAICIVNVNDKDALKKKLEDILAIKTFDYDRNEKARNYGDLIRGRFELNKVIRIERTNYINSISGKTGDLTLDGIHFDNKQINKGRRK